MTDREQVSAAVIAAAQAGPLRSVVSCAGIAPSIRVLGRQGPHDLESYAALPSSGA